jgi:uroporphyrinogen-III synthase
VLVVGTAHTTARAAVALSAAGAAPLPATVIATVPVTGPEVDEACAGLRAGRYGWLVITSSAAWRALRRRPGFLDRMTTLADPVRVAVVGPATADAVRADDVNPLVPEEAGGAAALVGPLVAAIRAAATDSGAPPARVLFAGGDLAATTLTDGLRQAGLEVDDVVVYRTVPVTDLPDAAVRAWRSGAVDDVVLTSPSAVNGLLTVLGPPAPRSDRPLRVAAIGDTTAAAATTAGLRVDVVGDASLPGLVRRLAAPPPAARPAPPPVRLPAAGPLPRLDDTPDP